MIVDSHVHINATASVSLQQGAFGAEELLTEMAGPHLVGGRMRTVGAAVCQPHPSDTAGIADVFQQHQVVINAVTTYPGKLFGCLSVNPHQAIELWLEALDQLVPTGFRAVKLHPTMHSWYLDMGESIVGPLMERCADHGVAVIIHTGDPPFAQPVQAINILTAHPRTSFVLAHLGTQQMSYAHQAIYVARAHPNVALEVGWGSLPRIRDTVKILGPERLVNATDCPILEMGSQLHVIGLLERPPPFGIGLGKEDVELVLGENAAPHLPTPSGEGDRVIIDAHVQVSEPRVLERLPAFDGNDAVAFLDLGGFRSDGREVIDRALVLGPPWRVAEDVPFRDWHREVRAAVAARPDRLIGCATLNPLVGADQQLDVLRDLVREEGFRAVRFHPTAHSYLVNKCLPLLSPFVVEATALGLPIIIEAGDPPFGVPVLLAPLVEAHAEAKFIFGNMGTQGVSYALEAIYVAQRNPNVLLETCCATVPSLRQAVSLLGPDRLVFASHLPEQDVGSQMALVAALASPTPVGLGLSAAETERIFADNLADLLAP